MDDSDLQKYEELKLYEKIHGTPISKLKPASAIGQHDLFVLTKRDVISSYTEDAVILDESQDGAILLEESDDGYLINED